MLDEALVERVQYHGDDDESLEANSSYAFRVLCSGLGIPPAAPVFHLRIFYFTFL